MPALCGFMAWASLSSAQGEPSAPAPVRPAAAASAGDAGSLRADVPKIGLKQAIDEALRREVRVAIALGNLRRAEALVTRARSGWLPSVIGHASYVRLEKDRRSGDTIVAPRDQLGADLTVNVPLLAVEPWVETGQARDAVDVARLDQEQVRKRVALSTAQAYLTVVAQHRSLDVQGTALENAQAHMNYAHTRYLGGIGNQIDDVRASQELESSRAAVARTRAALYSAQEALGVLVGRDRALDAAQTEVTLATPPTLAQALQDVPKLRGDVRANERRMRADERAVHDDWAQYMPLLSAQAQPFYREPSTPALPRTGWQVQLLLTLPLYDAGARSSLFEQRTANLDQDREQYAATLRQARSEVRVALSSVEQTDESLAAAVRASDLAAQALKMANVAYEAGASTNLEVIDAERRARDAATTVVVAEDAARQARLDLLAASGHFP